MLKSLRLYLFLLSLLASLFSVHAQNIRIDSLNFVLLSLNGEEKAKCLLAIAEEISPTDLTSSIKYANEALGIATTINNELLKADCRKDLGRYFYEQGKYKKAQNCFLKAQQAYYRENQEYKYNKIFIDIGLIYSRKGFLDSAATNFQIAKDWAKNNQDTLLEIKSLRSLGNIYYKKGQFDRTLSTYSEAIVFAELQKENNSELAGLYNNMGVLFSDWRNYDKSLFYYNKSLIIEKSLDNIQEQARIYNNMGTIYWYQDIMDSALYFYLKSLEERNKIDDTNGKAYVLNNLGMYYGSLADFPKSLEYFNKSLTHFEQLKNRQGIVMVLFNIGSVYQEEKNYPLAKKFFMQSLKIAEEQGFFDYIKENHSSLKDIYSASGDWEKAYFSLRKFKKLRDSIRKEQNFILLGEMELKFEKERKQAELQLIENQSEASKLENNRILLLLSGTLIILLLIIISTYFLVRQMRVRTETKYNELNPTLLRYQLNPQFIRSSLSGIKELIAKTRVKQASVFLAGLAKLIRVFVETSAENVIILEKEIDTIRGFLRLHQLRYDYELNFDLNIESDVETDMLAIPPFLFFPIYVHIIDNHLSKGTVNTNIDIRIIENYLEIDTDFNYNIELLGEAAENDLVKVITSKIQERVEMLNDTLKDKMYFDFTNDFSPEESSSSLSLHIKLPIKPI